MIPAELLRQASREVIAAMLETACQGEDFGDIDLDDTELLCEEIGHETGADIREIAAEGVEQAIAEAQVKVRAYYEDLEDIVRLHEELIIVPVRKLCMQTPGLRPFFGDFASAQDALAAAMAGKLRGVYIMSLENIFTAYMVSEETSRRIAEAMMVPVRH